MNNPIVELAELCQRKFRESIVTRVTNKTGADHCPIISVEIELPNGEIFSASGINQKEAKQKRLVRLLNRYKFQKRQDRYEFITCK